MSNLEENYSLINIQNAIKYMITHYRTLKTKTRYYLVNKEDLQDVLNWLDEESDDKVQRGSDIVYTFNLASFDGQFKITVTLNLVSLIAEVKMV
ncbi:MAG: hypothetical protein QXF40_01105 [Metallosphaera sp.]